MTTTTDAPTQIPVSPDFPISWEREGDEQHFWFQDTMHFPSPLSPLTSSFMLPAFSQGASGAIDRLSMPIVALRYSAFNGWVYAGAVPFLGTSEELEARKGQMIATLGQVLPDLMRRFNEELIPEIVAICNDLQKRDYSLYEVDQLAAHIAGLRSIMTHLWDMHMQINIPPMAAVIGFDEFLASHLGSEIEKKGHLMLQGFANKSVETGHRIWELAASVRTDEALVATLIETPAEQLADALAATESGRQFAHLWEDFIDSYGWRTGGFDFEVPTWIEDRTVPLTQLRTYLAAPETDDPLATQARQAVERDRIIAEVEGQLAEEVAPIFRMLLAGAQTYIPLAEDHNFYIDQMTFSSFRVPFLALGRALREAGQLERTEDVFYLDMSDVESIADGGTEDFRELVCVRRAAAEHFRNVVAPEAVGTPPPADVPIDPMAAKFFGVGQEFANDARSIKGIASSGGVIRGTVKVVRTLDEAGKLEAGDIMVCRMTMPAWTPLFATVGAVVADSGGVLSHCSIVAREYGIPCVTATKIGTRTLVDGQVVTVDGDKGIVIIHS